MKIPFSTEELSLESKEQIIEQEEHGDGNRNWSDVFAPHNGEHVSLEALREAQKEILEVALRLAEEGTIMLGGKGDDFL